MYCTAACPFCQSAERLLVEKGATHREGARRPRARAARGDDAEDGGRRTVPQIWIGERHVGGCDDLYALERQGGLDPLLEGDSMTTTQQQPAAATFQIEKIYVKDLSLEIPHAPQVFTEQVQPQIEVQINTGAAKFSRGLLRGDGDGHGHRARRRAHAVPRRGGAGRHLLDAQHRRPTELGPLLGIACPTVLFPYLRETISDVVTRGGFPPVLLAPISFEALYLQQRCSSAGRARKSRAIEDDSGRMTKVAVLGAGAWGTAISCVLAARLEVALWARDAAQAQTHRARRGATSATCRASRFRPRSPSPPTCCRGDRGCAAGPCGDAGRGLRELLQQTARARRWCGCARASSRVRGELPHQIARSVLGDKARFGALSGPSFAEEVAGGCLAR